MEADKRRIVLGVTGSIAAFKAAQLASDMVKAGFEVHVALTPGGAHFVTPLTFEALTGKPVAVEIWDEQPGDSRMGHLELARWANALVVAPASASALARLALGLATDMLTAVALASQAPLILAPAMETGMWLHLATQQHLQTLQDRGATVVGPEHGHLASGTEGLGRMSEPGVILGAVRDVLSRAGDLAGVRVLVTAGPTYEAIDPVRFIGNRSSGKMGHAVAAEARDRGAQVLLISGPTSLPEPSGLQVIRVESASQMRQAVLENLQDKDVIVMAAAVADFQPAGVAPDKMKRSGSVTLELVATPDIAAEASAAAPNAVHVGFALESDDLLTAAREKLQRKGQQLVVANPITAAHDPFGSETNLVAFVSREGVRQLPAMSKRDVAGLLWDEIAGLLRRRSGHSEGAVG